MPRSTKRRANLPSPCPIGQWSYCSEPPSSPLLWPYQAPALCGPTGSLLSPSFVWAHWISALPGTLPLGPAKPQLCMPTGPPLCQAPTTQACWISAPMVPNSAGLPGPHSAGLLGSCSTRPLHGRPAKGVLQTCLKDRQTGLDAKGVTPEQLRL
jgi:hypothetical protein